MDALLEATARILIREGYGRASTNRIAHVAVVSIGSLYQYFASKEALVAALIDRHKQQMKRLLRDALIKVAMRPVEEAARELVTVMMDAHHVDSKLHRVLVEQVPRLGRLDNLQAVEREAYVMVRTYLEAHRNEIDVAEVNLAAFICVAAAEALTHAAVVHRPEVLGDKRAAAFVGEVTALLLGYLKPHRSRQGRTG